MPDYEQPVGTDPQLAGTEREFYKTVITIEVLSEEPYDLESLSQLAHDVTDGGCSGRIVREKSTRLSRKAFVKACVAQGSDPEFFGLDENGNDNEDG